MRPENSRKSREQAQKKATGFENNYRTSVIDFRIAGPNQEDSTSQSRTMDIAH